MLTGGALTIANNLLIRMNILTDNRLFLEAAAGNSYGLDRMYSIKDMAYKLMRIVLFQSESAPKACGAIWFLATLFFTEIFYVLIEFISKKIVKNKHEVIMDMVMLFIFAAGVYCTTKGMLDTSGYRMHLAALSIFFFHIGKKLKSHEKLWQNPSPVFTCFVALAVIQICIKLQVGRVNYVRGDIKGGVYLLVISMAGWFFTYGLSQLISEEESVISISFKIVTYIQIIMYKEPKYMLASFPVLYKDGVWWIAYSIIGVCVPLFVYMGYKKIVLRLRGKINRNEKI